MATYTVSAGHKSIGPFALVAGQVDTVTFTDNVAEVTVDNSEGSVAVYVTADGSDPAVPAAGASSSAFRVPAGAVLDLEMRRDNDGVKLISSGTPTVAVQRTDA